MTDTIELLEAIGRDASLRHASADELMSVLERAQASAALKATVAQGDGTRLSREFGGGLKDPPPPPPTQHPGGPPGQEDEELEERKVGLQAFAAPGYRDGSLPQ